MAPNGGLTEDQAAVYDRQLRVWGIEVQNKLTAARVLIVGFGQLAAEVAKNIVLAGVGNVDLMDGSPVSDFQGRNFLITSSSDPDSSAAEAAAKTLQAMNPLVTVSTLPGSAASLLAQPAEARSQLLGRYQLVVATRQPLGTVRQLDDACRAAGTKMLAADVRGPSSYLFLDLQQHSFVAKATAGQKPAGAQQLSYPAFTDALSVSPSALPTSSHALYPLLQACVMLEDAEQQPPTAADVDAVRGYLEAAAKNAGSVAKAASLQLLPSFLDGRELAPVAAVTGGVVANNVVRAVSGSGAPLKNWFFYSLLDGRGCVEDLPPPGASALEGSNQDAVKGAATAADMVEL